MKERRKKERMFFFKEKLYSTKRRGRKKGRNVFPGRSLNKKSIGKQRKGRREKGDMFSSRRNKQKLD